jgi:hypothetical protein
VTRCRYSPTAIYANVGSRYIANRRPIANQTSSSGVDPAKLEDFSQWAAQRKQIASQVSDLGGPARRW